VKGNGTAGPKFSADGKGNQRCSNHQDKFISSSPYDAMKTYFVLTNSLQNKKRNRLDDDEDDDEDPLVVNKTG